MGFSVTVRHSAAWQMSSILLSSRGACLLVDPGYFPRELDELAVLTEARGELAGVVFTHSHFDHVAGWQRFPEAQVWGSPALAAAARAGEARELDEARTFDQRWYVQRPWDLCWPEVHDLAAGRRLEVGGALLEALLLPGHSFDGLALLAPEDGLLLVGDYLSPCEIPFVDDLGAYRVTLLRLRELLRSAVTTVVPGHGPRLRQDEALAIAAADLAYLDQLAACVERRDGPGAAALPLPRAESVPGMRDHHLDNCRKLGLVVPPTP